MAEERTDDGDVRLVFEHGRGTGVAERVGMHVLSDFCFLGVFLDEIPHPVF